MDKVREREREKKNNSNFHPCLSMIIHLCIIKRVTFRNQEQLWSLAKPHLLRRTKERLKATAGETAVIGKPLPNRLEPGGSGDIICCWIKQWSRV
jgi:hypothetical protein